MPTLATLLTNVSSELKAAQKKIKSLEDSFTRKIAEVTEDYNNRMNNLQEIAGGSVAASKKMAKKTKKTPDKPEDPDTAHNVSNADSDDSFPPLGQGSPVSVSSGDDENEKSFASVVKETQGPWLCQFAAVILRKTTLNLK